MELYTTNERNGFVKVVNKTIGRGVYSKRAFRAKDIVIYFHGPILNAEFVDNFDLGLQVGDNLFMMSSGDIDDYVNHSCDPNTILVYRSTPHGKQWCLVAIRPIKEGEQITFDYSITMSGRYWTMPCRCGSSMCRGTVLDFDLLPKSAQLYLINNIQSV